MPLLISRIKTGRCTVHKAEESRTHVIPAVVQYDNPPLPATQLTNGIISHQS